MSHFFQLHPSAHDYQEFRRTNDKDRVRVLHSPNNEHSVMSTKDLTSMKTENKEDLCPEELVRNEDEDHGVVILKTLEEDRDKEDVEPEERLVKDEINEKDNDKESKEEDKNQETFVAVIAQSILSLPTKRMTLSSIYSYIANNYPHFDKEKGPGWRNSVRHNLSSNDCFVKASRAENGKGHYWMIHPKDLPEFSKGNFRRPRKPRRPRCTHGIGCLSERTIFPSALGGSYYMSPYTSKQPEYEYSLPVLASSPDMFSRTYGIPSRYDTFQRDDAAVGISSYHGLSSSGSPTYLGFPWPDTSVFRNYAAISHAYYPYVIMPPTVSDVSVLQKDSFPKSKSD